VKLVKDTALAAQHWHCAYLLFLLMERKYELSLAPVALLTNGGPHSLVSSPLPGAST
jgi:hypothetical protein